MRSVPVVPSVRPGVLRRTAPRWLAALLGLATAVACSDTPDGKGNGSGEGGENQTCTGGFCLAEDRRITAEPATLKFSDIAADTSQELTLKLIHSGNSGTLQITAIGFDPPTTEFSVVEFAPASLKPSESRSYQVRYKPLATGSKSLKLIVTNNASDEAKRKLAVPVLVAETGSALTILPAPVDFGNVASAGSLNTPCSVANNGNVPLKVASISLSKSGSADFSIVSKPEDGSTLQPGTSTKIELRYAPTGGDKDKTQLLVETVEGKNAFVEVTGNEIAPRIAVVPPKGLQMGTLQLGEKKTVPMKILNQGLATLIVDKVEVSAVSKLKDIAFDKDKGITIPPAENDVAAGQVVMVTVTASSTLPKGGQAVASLILHSNDPGHPQYTVPIYAETNVGALKVFPEDEVDFSTVAKDAKSQRLIELFNEGSAGVDIQKVEITEDTTGEFSLVTGTGFAPIDEGKTLTLDAGKGSNFKVQFQPKTSSGTAKAKLVISSTDPQKPVWTLVMHGDRAASADCKITHLPPQLNFGLLPMGFSKVLPMTVKNVGTGTCVFKEVAVVDCPASGGLPLPGVPPPKPTCTISGSQRFKAIAPSTKLFNLGPGETGTIQVQFVAPEDLNPFEQAFNEPGQAKPYYGLMVLSFKDPNKDQSKPESIVTYPSVTYNPSNVATFQPNLQAKIGKAAVTVLPGEIDFGVITVGCKSKPQTATVYNNGIADAFVTKAELQGCGPEVHAVNWPAIPKTGLMVTKAKPIGFSVQYGPQNVGKDQCVLAIYTSLEGVCTQANGMQSGTQCQTTSDCGAGETCLGQLFTVPLKGEGTLEDEFTDEFVQGTKQADVLFVIDDSGSMSEEQKNLISNFQAFVQIADLFSTDYHLGLVTTDMEGPNGKLAGIKGLPGEHFVTPKTPDPKDKFAQTANFGTNGSADEQGLAAAEAALTLPNIYDSGKACNGDADCAKPTICIKNPDDGSKKCGGPNRAFLRKNAGLEVVILSDEEDSSPSDINYYVNMFYSIKGMANKNLFHLHAIVGDENGGCKGNGGNAVAGDRYITVAKATGGKIASICSTTFAQALKDIGTIAFGLAQQFFLTRVPEPSTITVKVNGKPCAQGANAWTYDEPSNSVIFAENGTCTPAKGDKITIWYKMLCFP